MPTLKKKVKDFKTKENKMDLAAITQALRGGSEAPQPAMPDNAGIIKARLAYRKYAEDAMASGQEPVPFPDWLARMRGTAQPQAQPQPQPQIPPQG